MDQQPLWIANGSFLPSATVREFGTDDGDELIMRHALVRVSVCGDEIEVGWSLFAPNWASLYCAMEWLQDQQGPINLRYFLAGWFEETVTTSDEARHRIHVLMAKSDVHLCSRTYIKEVDPGTTSIPPLLQDALAEGVVKPEFSVDMVLDDNTGKYAIDRIGPKSCIANLFGLSPVSYPCLTGHTYDQVVSQAYERVLRHGGPHYDHIIAAMNTPDNSVIWYPYQRVVLPHSFPDGRLGVSVVAQLSAVDIKVV